MTDFVPAERSTTIRQPSTANLMVDSDDRNGTNYPSPWNFQIARPQSILNGFFTRIATTEVVLEWNNPNISADLSNNYILVDVSGAGQVKLDFNDGFYTVAQLLEQMKAIIDSLTAATMTINYDATVVGEYPCSIEFNRSIQFGECPLVYALGLDTDLKVATQPFFLVNVDLRPYRFLDFVSDQLTYNQDLKDATTAPSDRVVLCRWYFDWDNASPNLDTYGFPIEMGYTPFRIRRLYNPPKQIRWSGNQPIGNLAFQVYGITPYTPSPVNNEIVVNPDYDFKSNWLMTLQVSEV